MSPILHLLVGFVACALYPADGRAVTLQMHESQATPYGAPPSRSPGPSPGIGQGEHLGQWMLRHQQLSPQQQQRALEQEPGFRELPPETQQRMRTRLNELNSMSPQQRQRTLARTEAMERLEPQQRQAVRSAMQELASLPPDRRHMVAQAFRDLRSVPPAQRESFLRADPRFQFLLPPERLTMEHLLQIEPYLPQTGERRPAVPPVPYAVPPPIYGPR